MCQDGYVYLVILIRPAWVTCALRPNIYIAISVDQIISGVENSSV